MLISHFRASVIVRVSIVLIDNYTASRAVAFRYSGGFIGSNMSVSAVIIGCIENFIIVEGILVLQKSSKLGCFVK